MRPQLARDPSQHTDRGKVSVICCISGYLHTHPLEPHTSLDIFLCFHLAVALPKFRANSDHCAAHDVLQAGQGAALYLGTIASPAIAVATDGEPTQAHFDN